MKHVRRAAFLAATIVGSVLLMMESAAQADPIFLDFNMDAAHPATASVSYDGLGGPFVGVDISVDSVLGINTPANDGVLLPITGGILSFTTGDFLGSDANNWYFGPGGSITVVGDAGFGLTTLMTGTFTNAQVVSTTFFKVGITGFLDSKDETLASFYGLGGNLPWTGGFNLSFSALGSPPAGFVSTTVLSGDIVNSPVPEPSSVIMGCFAGLAGLAACLRRRRG